MDPRILQQLRPSEIEPVKEVTTHLRGTRCSLSVSATHARYWIATAPPPGVSGKRAPGHDSLSAAAARLVEHAQLAPKLGVAFERAALSVWHIADEVKPLEVAAVGERLALCLDPFLGAERERPWQSVLAPLLAACAADFEEGEGGARAHLRCPSDPELRGELSVRPMWFGDFHARVSLELDDERALDDALHMKPSSWPFSVEDRVQCADALVDEAFFVRGSGGERLMRAIAPALRGWLELGGEAYPLELDGHSLRASAELPRAMVSRWLDTHVEIWTAGGRGFIEQAAPARWFYPLAPLPDDEPTDLPLQQPARRSQLEEIAARVHGERGRVAEVLRGPQDIVGEVGDSELGLRVAAHEVKLTGVIASQRAAFRYQTGDDVSELGLSLELHPSTAWQLSLERSERGIGVLRLVLKYASVEQIAMSWATMTRAMSQLDEDLTKSAEDLFIEAVRATPIETTPEGVELANPGLVADDTGGDEPKVRELAGEAGRLTWREPWHIRHRAKLKLQIPGYRRDVPDPHHLEAFRRLRIDDDLKLHVDDEGLTLTMRVSRVRLRAACKAVATFWARSR